ncbi:hypothetical protein HU200_005240 [Digitaria exilis]|uniref:Disease resistance protein At4g27190-like leucine-rich repeats domain-containing protein n=1 Tax=Digitaria exilis TaxID=1010633 RepID=A0A835FTG9_9POAL|nr:hypothetical protein HU200_005240 [Digitaria exilis]
MRSLQKAIAEELKLPQEVMIFFDQVDEEDDFDGVPQAARGAIPDVKSAIFNVLSNYKFLVVFHNGSGNYVDLWQCGVPAMGVMGKRVLWTSRGRFSFRGLQDDTLMEVAGLSDVAIEIHPRARGYRQVDILSRVFHAEADEVARYSGVPESKIVLECILYKLLTMKHHEANNIDWGTHAANYWVCDGIIQDINGCGRSAWEIGDALHRNINLDWPEQTEDLMRLVLSDQLEKRSVSGQDAHVVQALDLMAELRELHVKGPGEWSSSRLRSSTSAERSDNRNLLKLRVVGGAKDSDNNIGDTGGHVNQQASSFPNLSSWHVLKTVILDGCFELEESGCNALPLSLESFSFTSNVPTKIKSISFRGCVMLKSLLLRGIFDELVELDMSATSIKTLDLSEMQALHLKRLFLLGCQKLRAILWPHKETWLEVLRIDTTHATWAMEDMSNKQESSSVFTRAESPSATVHCDGQALTNSDSYISLRDARLFRSLLTTRLGILGIPPTGRGCPFIPTGRGCPPDKKLRVEVSSTGGHKCAGQRINNREQEVRAVSLQNAAGNLYIDDIIFGLHDNSQTTCTNGGEAVLDPPACMWMWACPFIPTDSDSAYCYIRIQDETPAESLQVKNGSKQEISTTLPDFVQNDAMTLHLYDCLSITGIPGPAPADPSNLKWYYLRWCRLERCPNLEGSVFPAAFEFDPYNIFTYLETLWASQLLKARHIWDWSKSLFRPGYGSFSNLVFLHLDHCPRLVHILPLYTSNDEGCHRLETLEILCCGELKEVFPSDSEPLQQKPREFPRLKRIHLYELPKLQHICGQRMLAPRLETVKIRGCWSLKRLPAVPLPPAVGRLHNVDCE